jgi:ribosomal protein S18 acetylase RimI-like enzyme
MTAQPQLRDDGATRDELLAHLLACDADFIPPLSSRVDLATYADKLLRHAARIEAWQDGRLVALVAMYCNDARDRRAFVTSVSVEPSLRGTGLGQRMMARAFERAAAAGMARIALELHGDNHAARRLYEKAGFIGHPAPGNLLVMERDL